MKSTMLGRLVFVCSQAVSLLIAIAFISSSYIKEYDSYHWRMNALLACIVIRVMRQCFWALAIAGDNQLLKQPVLPIVIGVINIIIDSLSIYFTARNDTKEITTMDYAALAIFGLGCILETGHDWLRSKFKSNPENKFKIYKDGFAKLIVYPNYCGFWLWHTGRALLSHNLYFATIISSLQFAQFYGGGIPKAQAYASNKYGKEYQDYIAKTYKMIPFVY